MKGVETKKKLSPEQREELLKALKARFEKNLNRHKGLEKNNIESCRNLEISIPRPRAGGPPADIRKLGGALFDDSH